MIEENFKNDRVFVATEKLVEYLNETDDPVKSSAIFIVGGMGYDRENLIHSQVVKAAELYKDGYAPKIIITAKAGANAGDLKMMEHEVYAEELRKLGVPSEAILAEPGGNDTLKEAAAGIELMKVNGIDLRDGLILTATPLHSRRAKRTWEEALKRTADENVPLRICPGTENMDLTSKAVMERAYGELVRLKVYARQGNLNAESTPSDVLKAAAIIGESTRTEQLSKFTKYLPQNK